MALDAKSLVLNVFRSNPKIEDINILTMPLGAKSIYFDVLDSQTSKSKILTPLCHALDAKSFNLNFFASTNFQIEDFDILGSCFWILKVSI